MILMQHKTQSGTDYEHWYKVGTDDIDDTLKMLNNRNEKVAKNVIIFVGDGMSLTTVTGLISVFELLWLF